jgi:ferritin-like metal-binding protein YciE
MSMKSLSELFEDRLKDLFSAETQLLKALPTMATKASSNQLKMTLTGHLKETEEHAMRLQQIAKILNIELKGKKCRTMEGLIEEVNEVLKEDGPPAVIDSALIGAVRCIEHHEMAAYCVTHEMAVQLGSDEVAKLLKQTCIEEKAADYKLKAIAQFEVYLEAVETVASQETTELAQLVEPR